MALLATRELAVSIGDVRVCHHLSLGIGPGSRWAILGRNGVGKSTLLKAMAGLHPVDGGGITLDGLALEELPSRQRAQRLGVMFQDQDALFPGTVLETALIGRHPWLDRLGNEGPEDIDAASAALTEVGLSGFEQRSLATLSGGERQRLSLAALLTQNPGLYLLDEPTNHLDPHHQVQVMKLLCRRVADHDDRALVMVLHDANLAVRFCDQALLLYGDGESAHGPVGEILNERNLQRLYGHPMATVDTGHGRFFYPE